jgi:DNA-binding transcriptional regulator GbsR (MarR family)
MKSLASVRAEFVELWGRLCSYWGVPPTTGRVYAWLLAQPEPRDGETIAAELAMSRGAVSMACKELADWGLLVPERVGGSRRVLYRPETNPEKAIRAIVSTRKRREWDPLLESLRRWRTELRRDSSRDAQVVRERLAEIEGIVALLDSMAESFLKGGVVQRLGLKAVVAAARTKVEAKPKRTES